jgi:hypothetical protein
MLIYSTYEGRVITEPTFISIGGSTITPAVSKRMEELKELKKQQKRS